jgi:uncharacterized protein YbjQ (UPF0145 family)
MADFRGAPMCLAWFIMLIGGCQISRTRTAGPAASGKLNANCFRDTRRISMAMGYTPSGAAVMHTMVTTQFELDGFRVVRTLGVVRGIVVRSRSIFGTIGASLQTILGGNITLLTQLCEKTRADAFDLMLQHATQLGANAVVGARYDATEIMQGVTEVLAYGTALYVEPISGS